MAKSAWVGWGGVGWGRGGGSRGSGKEEEQHGRNPLESSENRVTKDVLVVETGRAAFLPKVCALSYSLCEDCRTRAKVHDHSQCFIQYI